MHIESSPIKGILYCLLSYFFISIMGLFSKSISHSIAIPVILFSQNIVCFTLTVFELVKGKTISLKPGKPVDYGIRIVAGLACYASLFFVIRFIPVSEAMLYQYSASLWIPFIMLIWLKVKMPSRLWVGIIIGFAGMILILKPGQDMFGLVSIVGILSGILQGISVVAIRKLSSEPVLRVLFYYYLSAILLTSFFAFAYWSPINLKDGALLVGVGVTTYLGQKIFAYACQFAHPSTLAPICYTSILYTGLLGWIIWHEIPDSITLTGMALVITGCLLTVLMNRQKQHVKIEAASLISDLAENAA